MEVALPGFGAKEVEVTAAPSGIFGHVVPTKEELGKDNAVWTKFGSSGVYRRF